MIMLKYVLSFFAFLIFSVPIVNAQELVEENENGQLLEDKSWYEIDGIKIRIGRLRNNTGISLSSQENSHQLPPAIIDQTDQFSHQNAIPISPIAIVLPETLMTSWSFRGAVFEFQTETEVKDLSPSPDDNSINSETTHWRQKSSMRTLLYNDFFNASDKSFADSNPKWALSADVNSSRYFFGYIWGVFIPVGKNHRFFKIGFGPAVYYTDMSLKLNLCSEYKITVSEKERTNHGGECVGKTEIDSASISKWGWIFPTYHFTLWEIFTRDSVWKILSWTNAQINNDLKLKNHNDLGYTISSGTEIHISYTYRF